MLDVIHEAPPSHSDDSNTYTLESIKHQNVVIACLPVAQYGTNHAANVVTHPIRTFPSIRLGLMVRIGGGVLSMADIRLGDIVVGTRSMQYDFGKVVADGQLQRSGIPKTPSQLLGTAVSTLRSKHEIEPSRVPSILQEKFKGRPAYDLPNESDDIFYATYDHESPTSTCEACDRLMLVPRKKKTVLRRNKHSLRRDRLR
jgi:hypothetical protein